MKTESFWKSQVEVYRHFSRLEKDESADVVIIGGGITGIVLAENLLKQGLKVIVLESREIAASTTGNSTGNLYVPVQSFYHRINENFSRDVAYMVMQSRKKAIRHLETLAQEYEIDCRFHRRPWYMYTNFPDMLREVRQEFALFDKAGFNPEYTKLPYDAHYAKAIRIEECARFNPYAFVTGLSDKIGSHSDCKIYEKSHVVDFTENSSHVEVRTDQAKVTASFAVLATHVPKGINPLQLKNYAYRSYVVAADIQGKCPDGNFWELNDLGITAFSSHPTQGKAPDLMMAAGNHHKVGQEKDARKKYQQLEELLRKRFEVKTVKYYWSAQHYAPADGIPFIGKNFMNDRIFCATGYGTDGLVYGTVAALLLTDLMNRKINPLAAIYDSNRLKPVSSAKSMFKENINVALQFIDDFILQKYDSEFKHIPKGEGKVLEIEGEKCAVFKDEKGQDTVVSAICPHMKCVVHWNTAEKTWDCPCHGSRFSVNGEVLEGPSLAPLPQIISGRQKKAG